MDVGSNRLSRSLLIGLVVAVAAVITWFVLYFLIRLVNGIALPLLLLTAIFLIVLVLIQRGKGGGLAGAFGGLGGQSAFGTKAGDLFTRVTMGVALFWIILCMVTVSVLTTSRSVLQPDMGQGPVRQEPSSSSSSSSGKQTGTEPEKAPAGSTGGPASEDGSP
jgi:preprotein translocase subunit SecG